MFDERCFMRMFMWAGKLVIVYRRSRGIGDVDGITIITVIFWVGRCLSGYKHDRYAIIS